MSELIATEDTLRKVYDTLRGCGLTEQQAIDCISDMQNKGLYFREIAN